MQRMKKECRLQFCAAKRRWSWCGLGWYLVNRKVRKKLNLANEKVATQFNEFKKQRFTF